MNAAGAPSATAQLAGRRIRAASAPRQRASALVETLLAAPIVLLLGLGALQWALLLHARTAVEYASFEAARAGSVGQARPEAIEAGLARGLLPFWQGTGMPRDQAAALAAARARLAQGLAAGWIDWHQIGPTVESFADWAEPARDAFGRPTPGTPEIPNDSLQWSWLRTPAGDAAGMRGREPIGGQSQQTLNDANLLKLELRYAVPLAVPLVGSIAAWLMRIVDRCDAASRRQVGLVDLGTPAAAASPRAWACPMYLAPDASGRVVARWPVRVSATVRMQSPARRSAKTPHRSQSPVRVAATASGAGSPAEVPVPERSVEPAVPQIPADADAVPSRLPGWLDLGGQRSFSVPGACDA